MNAKLLLIIIIVVSIGLLVSLAGGSGGTQLGNLSVFVWCGLIAYAINWLAYLPANAKQTEHFYDLTGSLTYISIISFAVFASGSLDIRAFLAALMVLIWAVRLGSFLFKRIRQDGKDDRFDEIKVKPIRFLLAWTIQGLWAILTAACALAIITSNNSQPIGMIGSLGILIWLIGFLFEAIADAQKRAFKRAPENQGRFITTGLWAWCRHPNYFGEITLWTGMAILAIPILQGWQYLTLISPVFVFLLLTRVSGIPLLKKKSDARWGAQAAYQEYIENTPALFPRPPKS